MHLMLRMPCVFGVNSVREPFMLQYMLHDHHSKDWTPLRGQGNAAVERIRPFVGWSSMLIADIFVPGLFRKAFGFDGLSG